MRTAARIGALLALVATGCATEKPVPSSAGSAPASPAGPSVPSADAGPTGRPESTTAAATPLPPPGPVGPVILPPSAQPLVSVQLRFRTGSVDNPDGQLGITALAAQVMFEGGTEKLTSQQLREALFPYAAEWSLRVDKEQTTFAIRVHRDGLGTVAGLLTDALVHPRWDPAEFARLRDAVVNDIEKRLRQGDDENLGKEALGELIFAGHRYGWLTVGHVGDLRKLTLEELRAHVARVFTLDRLSIGIAGGYPADLQTRLSAALQGLPASGAPAPVLTRAVPHRPRFLLVEKQTASMAISIGAPWALGRGDADWAAMSVARSAFGEHRQFNGRLMQRLREMRGLNYGDYAYLEYFAQEGGEAPKAQTGRARAPAELQHLDPPGPERERPLRAPRRALRAAAVGGRGAVHRRGGRPDAELPRRLRAPLRPDRRTEAGLCAGRPVPGSEGLPSPAGAPRCPRSPPPRRTTRGAAGSTPARCKS